MILDLTFRHEQVAGLIVRGNRLVYHQDQHVTVIIRAILARPRIHHLTAATTRDDTGGVKRQTIRRADIGDPAEERPVAEAKSGAWTLYRWPIMDMADGVHELSCPMFAPLPGGTRATVPVVRENHAVFEVESGCLVRVFATRTDGEGLTLRRYKEA